MMRFRLLGPLEVRAGDDWRGIGAPKWRSVLAALLINAGQIVSAERLINEVWGDAPPAKAANLISIYVLRLRRLLGDADSGLLVTRAPGYQLRVAAADTDALLFEAMVRDGRRVFGSGDPQGAARQPAEGLALGGARPARWPSCRPCGPAGRWPTSGRRRWSKPRPNGWPSFTSAPSGSGSPPSSTAPAMTRGAWQTPPC